MANTYTLIASNTLASASPSITFSSIPSTYTDLQILCSVRGTVASDTLALTFNSSTTSYTGMTLYGSGSAVATASLTGLTYGWAGTINPSTYTASTFASHSIYIPNYAASNYKSFSVDSVVENNATAALYMTLTAGLWSNTSAITSIGVATSGANNMAQYSTFYLYGIKKN